MTENIRRMSLDQIRKLKSLSNSKKVNSMTEQEISKIIDEDPDLYHLTDTELSQFELAGVKSNEQQKFLLLKQEKLKASRTFQNF